MMKFNKNMLFILIIPVAGLVSWLLYQNSLFRITGTTPDLSKVSSISPFIDIHFSKEITADNVSITPDGIDITGFDTPDNKTLRIYLGELLEDTRYSLSLDFIASKDNKEIHNKNITFTAKEIPFEKLPKSQREAILKNQDRTDNIKSDPILAHVPYGGLHFQLIADSKDGAIVLQAEIRLSKADLLDNRDAKVETYKKEVTDYIQSKGLDPTKYTIEYEVIEPSIY